MADKHVFICGAKGFGHYGGFETFVDKLTKYHKADDGVHYHVACRANGTGSFNEDLLVDCTKLPAELGAECFSYHNASCFKIEVPGIGAAGAVWYDVASVRYCIRYCKKHNIRDFVVYVLACRIGPFIRSLYKSVKAAGGVLAVNPDGHEWQRQKWSFPVKLYWKMSERQMISAADRIICDSETMETYVRSAYGRKNTSYISYGAETERSLLADNAPQYTAWLKRNGLTAGEYYLVVCRFVPENSFAEILDSFMTCSTKKHLAVITTANDRFYNKLEEKLHISLDQRIRFTGTLYNTELLKKVRENACAYIHGHTVGGTNPTLLEAMALTGVNLVRDVPFNREVGRDAVLYWKPGELTSLLERVDTMTDEDKTIFQTRAVHRIRSAYDWQDVADRYTEEWESICPDRKGEKRNT